MTIEFGNNQLVDVWGATGAVVEPGSTKKNSGWLSGERPAFQWMNWLFNAVHKKLNYLMRSGIPEWNAATPYLEDDLVMFGGTIYQAVVDNTNSSPPSADWADYVAVNTVTPDGSISNAKLANAPANSVKGNATGSAATPTDIQYTVSTFLARAASGTLGLKSITDFALSLLDDADASTVLSTLGFSSFVKTLLAAVDAPAFRILIGASSTVKAFMNGSLPTVGATDTLVTIASPTDNVGGAYNTGNGRFTAPRDGVYLVTVSAISSASVGTLRIQVNGSDKFTPAYGSGYIASRTFAIQLTAGDYIRLLTGTGGINGTANYSYMSITEL